MALPSAPEKGGGSLPLLLGIGVFALIGVLVTGIVEQRSLQTNGSVTASGILGEWRATDNGSRIVFRPDKTLGIGPLGAPESADLEPGRYQLEAAGVVSIEMKSGKEFTANFREFTPNQFDLVDSKTQGVKVYVKTP